MKIVVLGGGISTERHVSLVSATSVCKALRSLGHSAVFVDMFLGLEDYNRSLENAFDEPDGLCGEAKISHFEPDIESVIAARKLHSPSRIGKNVFKLCALADCVFLALHGLDGEDGKIQAALDLLGIPYTGSGPLGSAMAMDKLVAKQMMTTADIPTPPWAEYCYSEEDIPSIVKETDVPCAVKIVTGGSSIGVELPDTKEELKTALHRILKYGNRILIEKKIIGRELTVPMLGGKALSPIEVIPPAGSSFDYVAKYQGGNEGAREICPADITESEKNQLIDLTIRLNNVLGLSVFSRADFILDRDGKAWCLEVNTLPGMTPTSLIPRSAKIEGLDYAHLCEKIVELSLNCIKN